MDDEEYEGFELEEVEDIPARRFRKGDLIVLALEAAYNASMALTNTVATARNLAGMHMNYRMQRDAFHEEAALEIETITGED